MAGKQTILVVEDDPHLADMLKSFFSLQGYAVIASEWGEDAVQTCQSHPPDIALLDVRLPDIDGYEVARRLRGSRRTQHIPLMFLTERGERADRLHGLELGAVDYVTKPFDLQELHLRVRNALGRAALRLLANPITGLPEGALVDEWLAELLDGTDWAVVCVDLTGLGRFRERFGFMDADNAARAVGVLLSESLRASGSAADRVGHLAPDRFIIFTTRGQADAVYETVRARLSEVEEALYPLPARLEQTFIPDVLRVTLSRLQAPQRPFASLEALRRAIQQAPSP